MWLAFKGWFVNHRNHVEFALFLGLIGLMSAGLTYVSLNMGEWVRSVMGV